jgi:hypothetical protein
VFGRVLWGSGVITELPQPVGTRDEVLAAGTVGDGLERYGLVDSYRYGALWVDDLDLEGFTP